MAFPSGGYYFVTLCTYNKRCLFWNHGELNVLGRIAANAVFKIPHHFPGIKIDEFVVMPNHIHMIVILEDGRNDLSVVIGQYKAFVSKEIHKAMKIDRLWQVSFHDHIIRNQQQYEKIWTYIENNPKKWVMDCFYIE